MKALLTDTRRRTALFQKNTFFSTPIQTLYFYILLSNQLQLRTLCLSPEGVCSRELLLYFQSTQSKQNNDASLSYECTLCYASWFQFYWLSFPFPTKPRSSPAFQGNCLKQFLSRGERSRKNQK